MRRYSSPIKMAYYEPLGYSNAIIKRLARAFHMIPPERIANAIKHMTSQDMDIRKDAYETIFSAKEESLPFLLEVIKSGSDAELEVAISYFWGFFLDRQLLAPNIENLLLDAIKRSASLAAQQDGLNFIGDILMVNPKREIQDRLIELLYENSWIMRIGAAEKLGDLKDKKAIPHLALLLYDEKKQVIYTAKAALEQIATPDALFAVQEWEKRK
jgi:HEAT repeat protein